MAALRSGPLGSDTLRHHGPIAARFVQDQSITGLHLLSGDSTITVLPFSTELRSRRSAR